MHQNKPFGATNMCDITLRYVDNMSECPADDVAHFVATYQRALRFASGEDVKAVIIHVNARIRDWLEHLIIVERHNGTRMLIGAIQRTVGAESEFCS